MQSANSNIHRLGGINADYLRHRMPHQAIWLEQGHQLPRDGRYVEMIKQERHQLVKLCAAAGIALNRREARALKTNFGNCWLSRAVSHCLTIK